MRHISKTYCTKRVRLFFIVTYILSISTLQANTSNQSLIDSLEQALQYAEQQYPDGHESQIEVYTQLLDQYRIAYHQNTLTFADKAMRMAEKYDNDELRLHILYAQGVQETNQGNYQEAKGHLQKGLGLSKLMTDPGIEPYNFINYLGIIYSHLEDYEAATKKYLEVIEYAKKNCEDYPNSFCTIAAIRGYNNIGTILNRTGKHEKALNYYEKALSMSEVLREKYPEKRELSRAMGATLGSIGHVYKKMERYENSETFFLRSIEYLRIANDQVNLPNALRYLSEVYMKQDRLSEAESMLEESIEIKEGLGLMTTEFATNYISLAELYFIKGNLEEALQYIEKSVGIVEELEAFSILSRAYELKARVLREKQDYVGASEALNQHRKYNEAYADSEHSDKVAKLASQSDQLNNSATASTANGSSSTASGSRAIPSIVWGALIILGLFFVVRIFRK